MSAELPAGVRVRAATSADDEQLRRVVAASGAADPTTAAGAVHVAEVGSRVIGVASLERVGTDALLRTTCVDPEWRGRGVGGALVEHLLTEAALDAADSVWVLDTTAAGFLARFGFLEVSSTAMPEQLARRANADGARRPGGSVMQLRLAEP